MSANTEREPCLDCMLKLTPRAKPNVRVALLLARNTARELEDAWTKVPIDVLEFTCPECGEDRHWWWFRTSQEWAGVKG